MQGTEGSHPASWRNLRAELADMVGEGLPDEVHKARTSHQLHATLLNWQATFLDRIGSSFVVESAFPTSSLTTTTSAPCGGGRRLADPSENLRAGRATRLRLDAGSGPGQPLAAPTGPPIPSSSSHPGGHDGRRCSHWLCVPNALAKR